MSKEKTKNHKAAELDLLTSKAKEWLTSIEGQKAIDSAIEKSDKQKERLSDLQCVDPKTLDLVVNL